MSVTPKEQGGVGDAAELLDYGWGDSDVVCETKLDILDGWDWYLGGLVKTMNSYLWTFEAASGDAYLFQSMELEAFLAEPVREEDWEGDGENTAW